MSIIFASRHSFLTLPRILSQFLSGFLARFLAFLFCGFLAVASVGTHAGAQGATGPLLDSEGKALPANAHERVITVGGSLTEIAYALGKEDHLVAVDTSSVFPPEALEEKPDVGYMRALSAEGILAMNPTLILAEEGSGPPQTIDMLREARVPFVLVPHRFDAQGILAKIDIVGKALKAPEKAGQLADRVAEDFRKVGERVRSRASSGKKRVLFLFSMRGGRLMVSGRNTQASAVIELAGAENVMMDIEGFKPVSNEAVLAADPDVILMMSRTGTPLVDKKDVLAHPALSETKAAKSGDLIVMPGMYLLGFGPRSAQAIGELSQKLYGNP